MTLAEAVLIFFAGAGGGVINSVAGGGSFITFPTLLFLQVPPITANASSTVALWPASLASTTAYRNNLLVSRKTLILFSLASLAGGLLGAWLLLQTSGETFSALIPWLLLVATVVFALGPEVTRRLRPAGPVEGSDSSYSPSAAGLVIQLVIATYGGFFGGGMGIMMLATYAALGMSDIHAMNGLKNWCAVFINGVAVVTFVAAGIVSWPHTLVMMAGAVLGGYGGAHGAKRIDPIWVRRLVITIGAGLSAYYFIWG